MLRYDTLTPCTPYRDRRWKKASHSILFYGILIFEPLNTHGPQPCLTQWNCEPCRVGPPKTDRSWWRVLTKYGPLEKGIANHFSILAVRTPLTVWKGKKRTVKDELPRSVGAQYATGDQWRNDSRKNEGMESKQKQHSVVDVTGDRGKVQSCKENIA